jgi:hypothetical protein
MGLTTLEQLQDIAYNQNIDIERYILPQKVRGLYFEEKNIKVITINKDVSTEEEETCVMAEEIGHSIIGGGDLFFPNGVDPVLRIKAEKRAKGWAYNKLLPFNNLKIRLKQQIDLWEIAEEFSLTLDFVEEAIIYYQQKGLIPSY